MIITRISLTSLEDRSALCSLINGFALSSAGGGEAMDPIRLKELPDQLAQCPTYIGLLAHLDDKPVGLLNAFWSVSTFKARPLINIHDITVTPVAQGRGIGALLITELERIGLAMDCCKLTLEVLEGNSGASALYERLGFEFYKLDPANGRASLMVKQLKSTSA